MNWSYWIPLLLIGSSLVPGVLIFFLPDEASRLRTSLNLAGATLKLALVAVVFRGFYTGSTYEARLPFSLGWDLVLRVDDIALLFMSLSAVLWFLTTLYAIGYLERSPNRSRFFGFFSLCVTSTMGICMAGNLFTFLVFYEMLTLTTYPLVVHRGTLKSLSAGGIYLLYTIGGGALILLGAVWIHTLTGPVDFQRGGVLESFVADHEWALVSIFALLVVGLGVKAAIFPLHGWLPKAMVAPAPVSALLHAVAVVKAGAFGIVRVVYDVFGIDFASRLGLLTPLAGIASFTILYGSIQAWRQKEIKKRLAFSTVSQVSYIVLGVALIGPIGTIGGLVHLVHQGLMKITLFFCAGNLAETYDIHDVAEMKGAGFRMPLTMGAFTIAAFGMIGVPPTAGFISKWYLGVGAIDSGFIWVLGVLVLSSLLNAAYFLPLIHAAWFESPEPRQRIRHIHKKSETGSLLLIPALITAALSLLAGLLASLDYISPLSAAREIVERMYNP